MITKDEALKLIETAIRGQGNQVDVGSVLPDVLTTALELGGGGKDITSLLMQGEPIASTLEELGQQSLYFFSMGKAKPVYMAFDAYNAYLMRYEMQHLSRERVDMFLYVQEIQESDGEIVLVGDEQEYPFSLEGEPYESVDISGTTIPTLETFTGTKSECILALGITEAQFDAILYGRASYVERGNLKMKLYSWMSNSQMPTSIYMGAYYDNDEFFYEQYVVQVQQTQLNQFVILLK